MEDFPERIHSWVSGPIRRYSPPLGFSIPYRLDDGTTATIYWYDGGQSLIPPGPSSPQVREQFEQSKRDVHTALAQGLWQEFEHLGDDVVSFGEGTAALQALRASFLCCDEDGTVRSTQVLVTAANNLFVKVRLSFNHDGGDLKWQNDVRQLLDWLAVRPPLNEM